MVRFMIAWVPSILRMVPGNLLKRSRSRWGSTFLHSIFHIFTGVSGEMQGKKSAVSSPSKAGQSSWHLASKQEGCMVAGHSTG